MKTTQRGRRSGPRVALAFAFAATLNGCRRAPSYSILGSFFPVWLFCSVAGIVLAFGVYLLLLRLEWHEQLAPGLLVWPSLAIVFSLTLWLMFFS